MAMGNVQAVNVATGTPEGAKYNAVGETTEIWRMAVTTALASGDTISGPVIPAGCYLTRLVVDCPAIGSGATFTVGYSGTAAGFITGGGPAAYSILNVAGALGYTATTPTTILITMTASATTPVAGTIRIAVSYTASP